MQLETKALIQELLTLSHQSTKVVTQFKSLPLEDLNFRETENSWSVLQCLEHLNKYGEYYLPEIEKQILNNPIQSEAKPFKSGVLGNYFANLMQVKNGQVKKMKSPKDKAPSNSTLNTLTIDKFLKQQERLIQLLTDAQAIDLTKAKTPISLTKWIKLRLGDTLRFYVYHIDRHIIQAQKALKAKTA